MTDPGALGTLMIGLESVRLDSVANDRPRRTTRRAANTRRRRAALAVVAGWLRVLADRLDRPAGTGQAGLATR
jgi:hypothetical protein